MVGEKSGIDKYDLEKLYAQEPNKSLLGLVQFKRWAYQLPDRGKEKKIKNWMRTKFGEPPVYYDYNATNKSIEQMQLFLGNLGYFNASIDLETKQKKKKIHLNYIIHTGIPYRINDYNYKLNDPHLEHLVLGIKEKSIIKNGDIYNAYLMDDERERITNYLKNIGYYNFNKEYIYFEVDSALNNYQMDVSMVIKNPQYKVREYEDSLISEEHKQYKLQNIYLNPDYDLQNTLSSFPDTMEIALQSENEEDQLNRYFFVHDGKIRIKPNIVLQNVMMKNGFIKAITFNLGAQGAEHL